MTTAPFSARPAGFDRGTEATLQRRHARCGSLSDQTPGRIVVIVETGEGRSHRSLPRWLPLALFAAAEFALADAPLRPPEKYTVCSSNQAFCAVADPAVDSVSVFARGAANPIWSLKPWHRQVFLANDGDHLVIGPPGLNMIPLDAKAADPLLVFMNRKAVVRIVPVGELFPNLASLRRTASHYAWGNVIGVSAHDQLIVQLVRGRRVAFDVRSGVEEAEK